MPLRARLLLLFTGLALGCSGGSTPVRVDPKPIEPPDPHIPPPLVHAPPESLAVDVFGPEVGAPTDVLDVSIDRGGDLWVTARSGLFVRPAGSKFFLAVRASDGAPRTQPRAVAALGPGLAAVSWISGPPFLVRVGEATGITVQALPLDGLIARIQRLDEAGGAVLASRAQLVTLDAGGAILATRPLPDPVEAWEVVVDSRGELWTGGRIGLSHLAAPQLPNLAGSFEPAPRLVAKSDDDVVAIGACSNGDLWVSALGNGVFRVEPDGSVTDHLTRDEVLPQDHVPAVACDLDGSVWLGTSWGGIARRAPDGSFTYYSATAGLPGDGIRRLLVEPTSAGGRTLWIATDGGLASYSGP
ncbi:hypothetical protein [Vulgatibacter incomptus]|uniref:Uncharacterized protein n=1 Tax=Vulgatibacter incomptus TaxID=1391653 RepID=A0A0K1PA18_9BACT|nr:hypothetical protein [Vulgatibacter incomptus]AKU90360.1 hypothetical protein AKJ08_0747 [Vulgatibacter incomptus]